MTNNQIKTLAMWQGLSLAQQIGIQNIRVLENSLLITKHMVDKPLPHDPPIKKIILGVQNL